MMIWVKMMEMKAYLNQSWKKIDRYFSLQGLPNIYILEYTLLYSCKSVDVPLYTDTLIWSGFPNIHFFLIISLPLGNATFT